MSRRTGSKLHSAMDYPKTFRRRRTAKAFYCILSVNYGREQFKYRINEYLKLGGQCFSLEICHL